MGGFPPQSINRGLRALSAPPSALIRFPLLSPVTASSARPECWGIMAAVGFANARWSDGNSHYGIQLAGVELIESGPLRLNNQPKIDIAAAANIVSVAAYLWRNRPSITPDFA